MNSKEQSHRSVDSIKSQLDKVFKEKFKEDEYGNKLALDTVETNEELNAGVGSPLNDPKHLQKQFSKATKN